MSSLFLTHPPELPFAFLQKTWDVYKMHAYMAIADALLDGASDAISHARFLAMSCPEACAWLSALPFPSLGLCMDDDSVHISVSL